MRRFNPRVLAGAAGVIVLVVLVWWFTLWGPRNRTYNDVSVQAQTAEAQVQQLQAQVDRLKSANLAQLNGQLTTLKTAIPDQPELDQIILAVNSAAQLSGVTLGTIAPTPPAASSGGSAGGGAPPQIALSISCSGGYFQILDFMNRLDALPRLLVIDSVNLGGGGGSTAGSAGSAPELTVSLTARMFVTQVTPTATGSTSGAFATTTTTTTPAGTAGTTSSTVPVGTGATTTTIQGATP